MDFIIVTGNRKKSLSLNFCIVESNYYQMTDGCKRMFSEQALSIIFYTINCLGQNIQFIEAGKHVI